ncbi:MAG TPA: pilus assembly protein PilP [Burkholderiaceae bacterium]|nr:pilus assembly protein PilP [Burkholderiaceae bacterium]
MNARSRRSPVRGLATLGLAAAAALLAGCEADRSELQTWMDETRRNTPTVTEKISEPKKFEPFVYQAADEIDPFSATKMRVAGATVAGRASSGLQPDAGRRREPLESFPLDNLKMVGNLRQGATNVALLQADAAVYQVRVGNYVGQNFGRVLKISENEVAIRETVQDAAGDWVERDTALQLQVQESRK